MCKKLLPGSQCTAAVAAQLLTEAIIAAAVFILTWYSLQVMATFIVPYILLLAQKFRAKMLLVGLG
jgi:hypothetical protein